MSIEAALIFQFAVLAIQSSIILVEAEGDAASLVHETPYMLIFAFTDNDGKAM